MWVQLYDATPFFLRMIEEFGMQYYFMTQVSNSSLIFLWRLKFR